MTRTAEKTAPAAVPPAEEIAPGRTFSDRAAGLAELVRDHPKTAIAAGAAVAAGVAAAIPLTRRGWGTGTGAGTGTGGKSNSRAKKA